MRCGMRTILDDYLDGALAPAQRAELERQINADPAMARLLAAMKQERALRAAAYAPLNPPRDEPPPPPAHLSDPLPPHNPAGSVGTQTSSWFKRPLAAAPSLAIVAGSFAIGRITATPPTGTIATVNPPKV